MKVAIILATALFITFSLQTNAFSGSRLDGVDCGPRMSRLDAQKCEKLARSETRKRTEYRGQHNKGESQQLYYSDGENDAWAGKAQKQYGGEYAEGYEDEEKRDANQNSTINGEWDTNGRHYVPAGGGNAWRDDGTFMQKAAGGFIDTKTGKFYPSN